MKSKIHENQKNNNTMRKKLTLILAFIGMITLNSCTTQDDDIDNDTISTVFEYSNVNFVGPSYGVFLEFPRPIFASDMVLVYRLSAIDQGEDVWKLLPETFYFPDGTLDFAYNFDFTRFDSNVYLTGNDLESISNNFRVNQVLRVVVIPASFGNKSASKTEFSNYNEVIKKYNIDDKNIQKIKL